MTTYNVHMYREMRLVFAGIEAATPEAAASIARHKPTEDADEIDDCEGESFSALVDMHGDEEYEQSRVIDFEAELLRKAAPVLLDALEAIRAALTYYPHWRDSMPAHLLSLADAAIAKAPLAAVRAEHSDKKD